MGNVCRFAFAGILLLGLSGITAMAQQSSSPEQPSQPHEFAGGHHRPMDVDSELAHLTKELDLTPAQQSQIRPILVEHQQKESALHQDQSLSAEELRTRAHAISDATHKQIESFLTDEQKQKVKAMQQRMHQRDQNSSPAPTSAPAPQGISDLTLEVAR